MDGKKRDPLEIFRRKLAADHYVVGDRFYRDTGESTPDMQALIAAQGKIVAFLAMLLDRERVLKASDMGNMLATIAAITAEENPAEGEILGIWAAGIQDVAAGL